MPSKYSKWKPGKKKRMRSDVSEYVDDLIYGEGVKTEPIDEQGMEVVRNNCSFFGCNKKLSLVESLCGNVCTKHMIKIKRIL